VSPSFNSSGSISTYSKPGRRRVEGADAEDLEVLELDDYVLVGIGRGSGVDSGVGRPGGGSFFKVSATIESLP